MKPHISETSHTRRPSLRVALLCVALTVPLGAWGQTDITPVFRFWSDFYGGHFFTRNRDERDSIIANYPDTWSYEGSDWSALTATDGEALPVYRFWSPQYLSHFYTISETEKDDVIARYAGVWNYEGVAWYAYLFPDATRKAVYRFWSDVYQSHFYTSNKGEHDYIIANYPEWASEGVAWYVPIGECIGISGDWQAEETLTISCSYDGQPEPPITDTTSGQLSIEQDGCAISYSLLNSDGSVSDAQREGVVSDDTVDIWGTMFDESNPSITFNQNLYTATGLARRDAIELQGNGWASGSLDDGTTFRCETTSTTTLTRIR